MKFALSFALLALVSAVLAADPAKPDDHMRNEFDRLLIQTMLSNFAKLEYRLIELNHEISHLTTTKSKTDQTEIVAEIEGLIATAERGEAILSRELARTDLNLLEKIDFESALKINQILVKNLKAAEAKVKAIKTN